MNILRLIITTAIFLGTFAAQAQHTAKEATAIAYMQEQVLAEGFDNADFQDFKVIQSYQSAHNGVTHVYIVQQYQGVEVEHAIFNINILPNGEVFHHGNRGVQQLANKIAKATPTMGCHEAYGLCLRDLGIADSELETLYNNGNEVRFAKSEGIFDDVLVRKIYAPQANGQYRMVWDMNILSNDTGESINYKVDVATGQLLSKRDITIKCQFDHAAHDEQCRTTVHLEDRHTDVPMIKPTLITDDGSTYNVFPMPGESPNHIARTMISEPADAVASPFGWHDVDGVTGADSTNTSGNNVVAGSDHDDDNRVDDSPPDGGASLQFDLPIDLNDEPRSYTAASIVNLFYMNNIVHDVAYRYGFDEPSGNFQTNNYNNGGAGGDAVTAFAQARLDLEPSGTTRNNATFSPSSEGFRPTMRMYVWERGVSGSELLEILSPGAIAGTTFRGHVAGFGPELPANGISGTVVQSDPVLGCSSFDNSGAMNGKIALIDRGTCNFDLKVENAADAGAIAVVICNFEEDTFRMGGTVNSGIPAVMIGNQDCEVLKVSLSQGLEIKLDLPPETGPDDVDGTLDNGIVAHEYGHGISTRLVGGPQRAGCLSNDTQMGEGWSDFFTLILSVEPGDVGATARGIGTFVQRDATDGLGIRRFPYSTDMSVNPLTLGDVPLTGSSPHALGTVWNTMIWDLYWALAERDGFDPDVYAGTGGNNTAIQLVMDGMKLLACSPSFEDARDAILAADIANNQGLNQRLIWEVFARRGLGMSAEAGSPNDRQLIREAFDVPGIHDPGLKIEKTMTTLVEPGEEITVTITVTNDNPNLETNVVVKDIIPADAAYINGSSNRAVQPNGDELTFNLGTLNSTQSIILEYRLSTTGVDFSDFIFYGGFEQNDGTWIEDVNEGVEGWVQSSARVFAGDFSAFIKNDTILTDRSIRMSSPIDLSGKTFPVLRFYHHIKSESGVDPGIVQITRDGGSTWEDLGDKFFRNGYTGKIPYQPFAIANQKGFFGDSGGFVDTYADLRDYIGDDVMVRFRYGSDNDRQNEGWHLDEVSIFDMINFQSEACVSSDQTSTAVCTEAVSNGTAVNYDLTIDVDDVDPETFSNVEVYPNPASDLINITITDFPSVENMEYKLFNVSGKYMSSGWLIPSNGNVNHPIDVSSLPIGMYFVNFMVGDQQVSKRFIKQ